MASEIVRARSVLVFSICLALVAITFAVYWQTLSYGFVNYDDRAYVSGNQQVQAGLNWSNIVWAFTHTHSINWHPLTTISHMLDCQLFGLNAGRHHLVNVILHSLAAVLLFIFLQSATADPGQPPRIWPSAFVAGMFAVHPLHVESVAWIAERKDVLSGIFCMLTLIAYVAYARRPSVGRYLVVLILFVCGLMSKSMLVTLPVILLLLDYWPLKRNQRSEVSDQTSVVRALLLEKVPFFLLSIGSGLATIAAQKETGVVPLKALPVAWRISNALAAYVVYIWQLIWPANLALGYPHPGKIPIEQTVAAGALLLTITVLVLVFRKRSPYLFLGWFWYFIMLLPVIGLIQVGGQAHADRYTYLPHIGLYIAIAWGIVDLVRTMPYRAPLVGALGLVSIGAFGWRTADQVWYWHDGERLWRHAIAVTKQNAVAHLGLAGYLADKGRFDEAILEYRATVRIAPEPDIETTLANLLLEQGLIDEAIWYYREVVRMQPESALAHYNLAVGLHRNRQLPEAIAEYKAALAIDPKYPDAEDFLNTAMQEIGQPSDPRFQSRKP